MATSGLGVPVKLLHESLGHVITVELKTGQLYRGKLAEGPFLYLFCRWKANSSCFFFSSDACPIWRCSNSIYSTHWSFPNRCAPHGDYPNGHGYVDPRIGQNS